MNEQPHVTHLFFPACNIDENKRDNFSGLVSVDEHRDPGAK